MPRTLPPLVVFTAALFVSAFLLFLVQPMQARMVLPLLGGSPAVWNTCMVFFQAMLLCGYAYAHLLPSWFGTRWHAVLHLGVLATAALVLPIARPVDWVPPVEWTPVFWLLGLLLVTVGLPFFCLATSAPLLQRWFTATGHPTAHDPYFLYAASNLGSVVALLSYPAVVEPLFALASQSLLWAVGYGVFFVLTAGCAIAVWLAPSNTAAVADVPVPPAPAPVAKPVTWLRRLRWVLLAFVPSSFMLSVSTYLTTDVAPIPLLWVLPLAVYLLTFVLVFARRPPIPHGLVLRWMPLVIIVALVLLLSEATEPLPLLLVLHLLTLYWVCMVCHGELARDRPPGRQLTEFYLLLSLGGVVGGLFNALVAPVIFWAITEYPLVLVLACVLRPRRTPAPKSAPAPAMKTRKAKAVPRPTSATNALLVLDVALPVLLGCVTVALVLGFQSMHLDPGPVSVAAMFAVPLVFCYVLKDRPIRFALGVAAILLASGLYYGVRGKSEFAARSFFGAHRVTEDPLLHMRDLFQGTTLHGRQNLHRPREPLTYYHRTGPIGQVFRAFGVDSNVNRVAVIGLGCGTLSCFAEPGQEWTFYEIDPVVVDIASKSDLFTYFDECERATGLRPQIELGDGRLTLARANAKYDVLVIDAFSSDSIPLHLLTREALAIYLQHLSDDGVLAFHVSNTYVDLEPVLGDLAADAQPPLICLGQSYSTSPYEEAAGCIPSDWVVIVRQEAVRAKLKGDWHQVEKRPGVRVWTDDYTNLLSAWRWKGARRGKQEPS
jgi:hypothetical protein